MNQYVLKINNLSKSFGKKSALNNVSISVKQGSIYGFIGKNGAGKTTTIKAICGLVIPAGGSIELFGKTNEEEVNKERKRIGALIESPAVYMNMTAKENLELVKIQRGIPGTGCIDKALEMVGLEESKNIKAKKMSLGMKQRLGIAMALINDPEFLILDEPINAIDPIGIKQIRELLLKLNKERGTTILISSHILTELTHICDTYGFIDEGKIVEEISAEEYKNKSRSYVEIKVTNNEEAIPVIENVLKIKDYEVWENNSIRLYEDCNTEKISLALAKENIGLIEIKKVDENLEDYFNRLVGGEKNA